MKENSSPRLTSFKPNYQHAWLYNIVKETPCYIGSCALSINVNENFESFQPELKLHPTSSNEYSNAAAAASIWRIGWSFMHTL
ncbi:hypothetical protein OUZ56_028346 [Daphnia magna]|uniref:Uncharacterized protein n=1 Tax=Daphnia magna TaxID=35525 RepID=A0ABR0B3Q8_9CRUS|nr:hypothetical protein OUZ56_028346 [Daphnia magna]